MARSILFGILSGALAGLGVGYLIASTRGAPEPGPREVEAGTVAPGAAEADRDRAPEPAEPADLDHPSDDRLQAPVESGPAREPAPELEPEPEDPGLLSGYLVRYVDEQLALGWKNVRQDEIPEPDVLEGRARVKTMLRDYPAHVGAQLAEEATGREHFDQALTEANAPQLLALIEDGLVSDEQYASVAALADDRAALRSLYGTTGGGPTIAGAGLSKWDELAPNATISYGAGVYALRPNARELPRGLVVQGAGMDATLLVLMNDTWSRTTFDSLELRDVSIFTNHNYLFDQNDPASLTLRNVRVMGYDMGAGGSVALSFSDGLVLDASGCQFLGGYGGFASGGSILRGGTLIARFERCLMSDTELGYWDSGSRVLFVDCQLERMLRVRPGNVLELAGSTTLTHHPEPQPGQHLKIELLDLNELFYDWQERMRR